MFNLILGLFSFCRLVQSITRSLCIFRTLSKTKAKKKKKNAKRQHPKKTKLKERESGWYLYAFVPGSCDSLKADDLKLVVFFYGHNQ